MSTDPSDQASDVQVFINEARSVRIQLSSMVICIIYKSRVLTVSSPSSCLNSMILQIQETPLR